MILQFEVTGGDDLVLAFEDAADEFGDRAAHLFERYGKDLRDLTRQLTPKDTGFMANAVKYEKFGIGFEVGWFWPDFAAAGHAPYYWWVEFGKRDAPAQPSLGPAWAELQPHLLSDLNNLFRATFR